MTVDVDIHTQTDKEESTESLRKEEKQVNKTSRRQTLYMLMLTIQKNHPTGKVTNKL